MKKGILQESAMFVMGSVGDIIDVYTSLDELNSFPNANKEVNAEVFSEMSGGCRIVGFAKSDAFTDKRPEFVQLYDDEVKFIEE